ncbi:vWA domain-containing protein [Methylocapsa polymorpha]|uniref:VWA domain-containing protein n=1 Tax=Methylocapsa polymorpha TaxID=3080828 RepID=A0ABZ0HVM4_9HYPH|nr:vWA domain-containing protein [Methylocapsa sp. RX1]
MNLSVDHPELLWLLLVAFIPLINPGQKAIAYPWLAVLPRDRLSLCVDAFLRMLAAICVVALVLGIAGLHRKRVTVEHIGEGAHIVLLLDRSLSMDQTFANQVPAGREESKTAAAVRLVKAFFSERPHDQFAVVAFSTSPILAMPMTAKRAPIMAALDAMNRPALAHTDIGRGLGLALATFKTDFDTATRVILFVSDGAGVIDRLVQEKIRSDVLKLGAHIYYLYLRTEGDPGLFEANALPDRDAPAALHRFFESLGVPYRAFEADNPDAIRTAVETINRLETSPAQYFEQTPRRDYSSRAYAVALAALLLLLVARLVERRLGDSASAPRGAERAVSP